MLKTTLTISEMSVESVNSNHWVGNTRSFLTRNSFTLKTQIKCSITKRYFRTSIISFNNTINFIQLNLLNILKTAEKDPDA